VTPFETAEFEIWIERGALVRKLARALVSDPHDADDLAQEAWLVAAAARGRGRDERASWTAWIAGVMRNLARNRRRGDARRGAREREAARPEPVSGPDELLERLDVHERLISAVRELDEPYRATILLRYFEELSPPEIAARTGTPLRTVHTRITRGLERLRASLDRRAGGRGAWIALLIPLIDRPAAGVLGALMMDVKLKVAVGATMLAGLFYAAWLSTRDARPDAVAASAERAEAPALRAPEPEPVPEPTTRESIPPAAKAPVEARGTEPEPIVPAAAIATSSGRVVDLDGRPTPGVPVRFLGPGRDEVVATTDERGAFTAEHPGTAGSLEAVGERLVNVFRSRVSAESDPGAAGGAAEHVIVVAPRISLGGRVVGPDGRPLAAAEVRIRPRDDIRSSTGLVLDAAVGGEWSATTDEHGEFQLPAAPAIERSSLVAELQGYEPSWIDLPSVDDLGLDFVLRPHRERDRHLLGRVVDELGRPVEGAHVALVGATEALMAVTTNAHGRFDVALTPDAAGATAISALSKGRLPAQLACVGPPLERDSWPDPLVLVLDRSPLSIEGLVLDADGRPVPNARLDPLDGTSFGMVEAEISGTRFWTSRGVESLLGDAGLGDRIQAGADGRFRIGGLLPRAYRYEVSDPRTLEAAVSAPIEAGRTGVEIRLGREERHARIAGIVVDRRGNPVAGATLWADRRGAPRTEGSARSGPARIDGSRVHSDTDGAFELIGISKAATSLCLQAPDLSAIVEVSLAGETDLERLRIVVSLRCHAQVDLTGSSISADSIGFLDAEGEAVSVTRKAGDVSFVAPRFGLVAGRSEVLSVPDEATTLVFFDGEDEVTRVPVELVPGRVNVLRP
jgi:RNA polymerase sigma factor (sigma-70 family)